jgi:hypothetical protein
MNITYIDRIENTLARAEARLLENKSSIKTYAAAGTAGKAADALSEKLGVYWGIENAPVLVLQLNSGRYFLAADLQDIIERSKTGGYVGAYLDGHWTISTDLMAMNSRAAA